MKKVILIIAVLLGFNSYSQNPTEEFAQANKLYQEQKFEEALSVYESLITKNYISADLYYNLANTYYKLNRIAPSVLYYRKALKLNPNMEDAVFNLKMAEALTADKFEHLPKTNLKLLWENISEFLTVNQWAYLSLLSSLLTLVLFLWFKFSLSSSNKRLAFVLGVVAISITVFSVFVSFQQKSHWEKNKEAVVMVSNTYIKVAPNQSSEDAFILHEGSSIIVVDQLDDWFRIKLSDGKVGWIKSSDLAFV